MFCLLRVPSWDKLQCGHHVTVALDTGNLSQVALVNHVTKPTAFQSFLYILPCHPMGCQITAVEYKSVVFQIEIGTHFCIIISLWDNNIAQYIFQPLPHNHFTISRTKNLGHALRERLDILGYICTHFFKTRFMFISQFGVFIFK